MSVKSTPTTIIRLGVIFLVLLFWRVLFTFTKDTWPEGRCDISPLEFAQAQTNTPNDGRRQTTTREMRISQRERTWQKIGYKNTDQPVNDQSANETDQPKKEIMANDQRQKEQQTAFNKITTNKCWCTFICWQRCIAVLNMLKGWMGCELKGFGPTTK